MITVEIFYLDGTTEIISCDDWNIHEGILSLKKRYQSINVPLTSMKRFTSVR